MARGLTTRYNNTSTFTFHKSILWCENVLKAFWVLKDQYFFSSFRRVAHRMWFFERVNMENIKLVSAENGQLKLISLSNRWLRLREMTSHGGHDIAAIPSHPPLAFKFKSWELFQIYISNQTWENKTWVTSLCFLKEDWTSKSPKKERELCVNWIPLFRDRSSIINQSTLYRLTNGDKKQY